MTEGAEFPQEEDQRSVKKLKHSQVSQSIKNTEDLEPSSASESATFVKSLYVSKFSHLANMEHKELGRQFSQYNSTVGIFHESDEEKNSRCSQMSEREREEDPARFKLELQVDPEWLSIWDELEIACFESGNWKPARVVEISGRWVHFVQYPSTSPISLPCNGYPHEVRFANPYDTFSSTDFFRNQRKDQCSAIKRFKTKAQFDSIIFPISQDREPLMGDKSKLLDAKVNPFSLLGVELNTDQIRAVAGILECRCRPAPYVVLGPPGSGKTTTLVEAVRQIHMQNMETEVLICGSTDDNADRIAEALVSTNAMDPFRNMDPDEVVRLPDKKKLSDMKGSFDDTHIEWERLLRRQQGRARHSITVTTCKQADTLRMKRYKFDYLIVDDANRLTEPEVLVPITLLKPDGVVVLAGDPKQLGPICVSSEAEQSGLGVSMLERLSRLPMYEGDQQEMSRQFDNKCISVLSVCYGYSESIMKINNELFYSNQLKFAEEKSTYSESSGWEDRILFFRSPPCYLSESSGDSLYNIYEAGIVVKLAQHLIKHSRFKPEQVGIVTFYRAQHLLIERMIRKMDAPLFKVGTLIEFQSHTRDVIIISTVLSDTYTKIIPTKASWFNVATSRATRTLILVGYPPFLRRHEFWAEYMKKAGRIRIGSELDQSHDDA